MLKLWITELCFIIISKPTSFTKGVPQTTFDCGSKRKLSKNSITKGAVLPSVT